MLNDICRAILKGEESPNLPFLLSNWELFLLTILCKSVNHIQSLSLDPIFSWYWFLHEEMKKSCTSFHPHGLNYIKPTTSMIKKQNWLASFPRYTRMLHWNNGLKYFMVRLFPHISSFKLQLCLGCPCSKYSTRVHDFVLQPPVNIRDVQNSSAPR